MKLQMGRSGCAPAVLSVVLCAMFIGSARATDHTIGNTRSRIQKLRSTHSAGGLGSGTGSENSWSDPEFAPSHFSPLCRTTGEAINIHIRYDNLRSTEINGAKDHTLARTARCLDEVPTECISPSPVMEPDFIPKACDSVKCPCKQDTHYLHSRVHRMMMDQIQLQCDKARDDTKRKLSTDPFRMLLLGMGIGSMQMYTLDNCKVYKNNGLRVESVEQDPHVVDVAKKFFGFDAVGDVSTIENKPFAQAVLDRANRTHQYDVVVVDTLDSSGNVPGSCRDKPFIHSVEGILRPHGFVIQNIRSPQYLDALKDYRTIFGEYQVKGVATGATSGDYIISAQSMGPSQSGAPKGGSLMALLTGVFAAAALATLGA